MAKAGDEFRYRRCVISVTGAIASVVLNTKGENVGGALVYTAFGFLKPSRGRSFIEHCDSLEQAKRAIDEYRRTHT